MYYNLVLPDYFKDDGDRGRIDTGKQKAYHKIVDEADLLKAAPCFLNGIIISDEQLDDLKKVKAELEQIKELTVISSYYNNIEISPQGISKAVAIAALQAKHQIPRARTIVFGDGGNDIEMFKMADISVAMANSSNDVKAAARYETKSNQEDGVYYFLENYFKGDWDNGK